MLLQQFLFNQMCPDCLQILTFLECIFQPSHLVPGHKNIKHKSCVDVYVSILACLGTAVPLQVVQSSSEVLRRLPLLQAEQ